MTLLDTLLRRPQFGDFPNDGSTIPDDDDWLDDLFAAYEHPRLQGLIGNPLPLIPWGGRIPWPDIAPLMPLSQRVSWGPGWATLGFPVVDPIAMAAHWTGSAASYKRPAPSLKIITEGRKAGKGVTAVPAPLVPADVAYDGMLTIVASGRGNHLGTGDKTLLDIIRRGGSLAGKPGPDNGGSGGSVLGAELEFIGNGTFSPEQIVAAGNLFRAWALHYGWDIERTLFDHARWTRRKRDVRGCPPWETPEKMRADVIAGVEPTRFILQRPNDPKLYAWEGKVRNTGTVRIARHIGTQPEAAKMLATGWRQIPWSGQVAAA